MGRLEVAGISTTFGPNRALRDATLTVEAGEIQAMRMIVLENVRPPASSHVSGLPQRWQPAEVGHCGTYPARHARPDPHRQDQALVSGKALA
jgi:hypothetical protein